MNNSINLPLHHLLDGPDIKIELHEATGTMEKFKGVPEQMIRAFCSSIENGTVRLTGRKLVLPPDSITPRAFCHILEWMLATCESRYTYHIHIKYRSIENFDVYKGLAYLGINGPKADLERYFAGYLIGQRLTQEELNHFHRNAEPDSEFAKHLYSVIERKRWQKKLGNEEVEFIEAHPDFKARVDAVSQDIKERRERQKVLDHQKVSDRAQESESTGTSPGSS
ncbi:hypothetical protein K490DRAFT_61743 [Saccharata proteae CBS 121410]|uniref:Uncharacterized protein n=1 Tax=Saccharata proteae CBS 121410 TaxID=1314787 RepID=A0A9P4I3G0_9PEZI|nr:hypothetical protein K490DRAFT_61743 [Saccharata proteae CBS 121410]